MGHKESALPGGKKKPLKAPKKESKELDDVKQSPLPNISHTQTHTHTHTHTHTLSLLYMY